MNRGNKNYFENFIKMESNYNLFSLEVKNQKIWDHLRYKVFYSFNSFEKSNHKRTHKKLLLIFDIFFSFFHLIPIFLKRKQYDIVIFGYDRRSYVGNKLVNITFYPLIKHLYTSQNILYLYSSPFSNWDSDYPCDTVNVRFFHYLKKLASRFIRLSKKENRVIEDISKIIEENLGYKLNSRTLKSDFLNDSYIPYKFYSFLFKRLKPKIFLTSDSGSSKGIFEAANENSIRSIDFQHSLMSKYNILYAYADGINPELIIGPKEIYTFGQYWNDKYNLPIKRTAVGFPYFEFMKEQSVARNTNGKYKYFKKNKTVLIISSINSRKQLDKFIREIAKELSEYNFIYKLRPEEYNDWEAYYSKELKAQSNVYFIDSNDYKLYDLFLISDIQIGINSTALIEGLGFDLKTLILKDGWYLEMEDLINSNYAVLVDSKADAIEAIKNKNVKKVDKENIFMSHSLYNIDKELGT